MSNEADRLIRRQGARPGLHLLNLSAWIREQRVLQVVYRQLPPRWRNWASSLLASRASASARFPRTPRWDLGLERVAYDSVRMPAKADGPGLNLLGYMRGQFGLAESARLYARALIDYGADVALYDIDLALPHGWEDGSLDAWIGTDAPHEVSIIFVNPDYLKPALEQIGEARLRGRYLIACWFWELEKIPDEWLDALALVDEIMVASEFVEDAFRRVTEKPVLRVPLPLSALPDSGLQRCCDAYVSLHRAEGFGLGLAECMALGKPVIATGWSGNLEFMDSESALLVEFRRIPVREGDYPHPDGAEWAEADVGAAATAMRKLADDPVAASRLGARARTAVLARLSPENAARIILNRVREIKAGMNKVGENHG